MRKRKPISRIKQFFTSLFSFYMSAELDITSVAVAYYIIISVFPLLMLLASLLPYFRFDVNQILVLLKEMFPEKLYPTAARMVSAILTQPSNSWLGVSIVTTLWTISRSMAALQKAVNKAYGVDEHRDFIISHVVGVFLGIGLQFILMLSVLMIAFGNTVLQTLHRMVDLKNDFFLQLASQTTPVVYVSLFLSLMMLYFFLPNVRIKKIRYVLPGTIFVMLVMGTIGRLFTIYIDAYANRLMDFRFVTSVIILVLMLWFVFVANILITGAVLNATVQSLFVDEFYTRNGNVVSILNRLKKRFRGQESEETKELVPLREKEK